MLTSSNNMKKFDRTPYFIIQVCAKNLSLVADRNETHLIFRALGADFHRQIITHDFSAYKNEKVIEITLFENLLISELLGGSQLNHVVSGWQSCILIFIEYITFIVTVVKERSFNNINQITIDQ